MDHFKTHYSDVWTYDLTKPRQFDRFFEDTTDEDDDRDGNLPPMFVGVINYELAWRRPELSTLRDFTMMLDESSMIQNYSAKQTKFIIHKLHPSATILLSGTPTDGKYERLWTQMKLLGWKISKSAYEERYTTSVMMDYGLGFKVPVITGYKNVDELKQKMREYGCVFMKTEEAFELPDTVEQIHRIPTPTGYKEFMKKRIVTIDGDELIGDSSLTMRLRARQICGSYSHEKLQAVKDILDSTSDRVIIFYNFYDELEKLMRITDRPVSVVNGKVRDLGNYRDYSDAVTFIQYQAGARGLNLQLANQIIYYSLPESSELFEQSKARIHRIGQERTCFYHIMECKDTIEGKIYDTLKQRKDYTDFLFKEDYGYE